MTPLRRWKHEPLMRMGASTGAKSTGVKERGNAYHRKIYRLLELNAAFTLKGWKVYVEPWFRELDNGGIRMLRSPDAVLVHEETSCAIVVEVKLNWKDGRDEKLLNEYLPIVKAAFSLDETWPLLITQNIRGYEHPPLLGLERVLDAMCWQPGKPTPVMLVIK